MKTIKDKFFGKVDVVKLNGKIYFNANDINRKLKVKNMEDYVRLVKYNQMMLISRYDAEYLIKKSSLSARVISLALASIISLCTIFTSNAQTTKTKANTDNKNNYTININIGNNTINTKSIGIKGKSDVGMNNMRVINGKEYKCRKLNVKATAYYGGEVGGQVTYMGTKCRYGVIAVDPKIIPLGSKVYIPQLDMIFSAEDTGGKIKGNRIDIFMKTKNEMIQWGVKNIDIYVLED